MPRGMSVHIGVNKVDPEHYDGWDGALTACEADANAMEAIAKSKEFETSKLLTAQATADAITSAIENAARELGPEDIFLVTYAGHGGQVKDTNGAQDESDSSDETWLAYDRQIIDDELYALWGKFKDGVRIFVISDSCHSGSVNRAITDERVPDPVATAENAARQDPRFRALPRDKMISTYTKNQDLYDGIQDSVPSSTRSKSELKVRVLLISGCEDDQLSRDGFANGRFTEELLKIWNDGAWRGSYPTFHQAILEGMPDDQQPAYNPVGAESEAFDQQDPFTV